MKKIIVDRSKPPIPSSPQSKFWHDAIDYVMKNGVSICPLCNKSLNRHKLISHNTMQIKCKCNYTIYVKKDDDNGMNILYPHKITP